MLENSGILSQMSKHCNRCAVSAVHAGVIWVCLNWTFPAPKDFVKYVRFWNTERLPASDLEGLKSELPFPEVSGYGNYVSGTQRYHLVPRGLTQLPVLAGIRESLSFSLIPTRTRNCILPAWGGETGDAALLCRHSFLSL